MKVTEDDFGGWLVLYIYYLLYDCTIASTPAMTDSFFHAENQISFGTVLPINRHKYSNIKIHILYNKQEQSIVGHS